MTTFYSIPKPVVWNSPADLIDVAEPGQFISLVTKKLDEYLEKSTVGIICGVKIITLDNMPTDSFGFISPQKDDQ